MGEWKDRLVTREKLIEEEKYPELALKEKDPLKWELLNSRLSSLVQNARETAKLISASPVVREMGECIFALFTPEGDSVCFSTGLFLHVASMGGTIKWMLKNDYEERVGIREGDHFLNNDPYIGGAHTHDQTTVTPIFYKGHLVGWAGGLNHVPETGTIEIGGISPVGETRFDEGLFMNCLRIAENDEFKADIEIMVERNTRTPIWWLLDARARSAGIKIIRDIVRKLIDEYGVDYYMQAIYEYIEDCRQSSVKKLKLLFPGKYHAAAFLDLNYAVLPRRHPKDYLLHIPVETIVTADGKMTFDFEGASPAGPFYDNAALAATLGNIANQLIQILFFDVKYNQGMFQAWKALVPPSVLNPPNIYYACGGWRAGAVGSGAVAECISRSYFQIGYREEIQAGIPMHAAVRVGGIDQYGRSLSIELFEGGCSGMPASGVLDGLDVAYAFYNPLADTTDAEMWEKIMPLIYLGRGIFPDSGGFGKYRGGNALEELFMLDQTETSTVRCSGTSGKAFVHRGLMGGYPAVAVYRRLITNTNAKELIDRKAPFPHKEGSDSTTPEWVKFGLEGQTRTTGAVFPETEIQKYDLLHFFNCPAGGYGDPIERDPRLIKRDLENGVTTLETAERVYKVSINPETLEIDYDKTQALREKCREDRKRRGIPAAEYWRREKEKIIKGDIPAIPRQCLNDCFRVSDRFLKDFVEFWGLPEDFKKIEPK